LLNYRDRGNATGAFNIAYGRWPGSCIKVVNKKNWFCTEKKSCLLRLKPKPQIFCHG
jgi:hypothetical protein